MSIDINLKQTKALLSMFGEPNEDDEPESITVQYYEHGQVKGDNDEPLQAGLYAYYAEYPEEGCVYLGKG